MKLIHFQSLVLAITTGTGIAAAGPVIRQDRPAGDWQSECLPIGNGRLGAMTFGGIEKEHIQFNEDSVWIGDATNSRGSPYTNKLRAARNRSGSTAFSNSAPTNSHSNTPLGACSSTFVT